MNVRTNSGKTKNPTNVGLTMYQHRPYAYGVRQGFTIDLRIDINSSLSSVTFFKFFTNSLPT